MSYSKLALRGGGVRGIIYIGLINVLNKLGILQNIDAVSGSSVGAIAALLIATGWDLEKIKQKMLSIDFKNIINDDSLFSHVLGVGKIAEPFAEGINFKEHFGLHQAKGFEDFFKSIIKEVTGNEESTFAFWHELAKNNATLKNIYVEACNMNTEFNEVFSYRSAHKNVPIWKAIRASMAFPIFFTPQEINGCFYGDGGMQKNCPNEVFETIPGIPNPDVLSVWLDSRDNINYYVNKVPPIPKAIPNFVSYLSKVINTATSSQNYYLLQSLYREQMIYCDTLGIDTLDFAATKDPNKINAMIASGENGTINFFLRKHPEMVTSKIDQATLQRIQLGELSRTTSAVADLTPVKIESNVA